MLLIKPRKNLSTQMTAVCGEKMFPNTSTVHGVVTLPVGSYVHSRSCLRRLKISSRTSTGTDRQTDRTSITLCRRTESIMTDVEPIDIAKRWDASLHRLIALAFHDEHK